MPVDGIWTAAELEAMTPNERDAVVRSAIVTDPDKMPADLVARARARVSARIEATEGSEARR